jgi:hypothetical protein
MDMRQSIKLVKTVKIELTIEEALEILEYIKGNTEDREFVEEFVYTLANLVGE